MGALVSCILPTKDRPNFLAQAIRCFLRQTYSDRELIIVDDSNDTLEKVIPKDTRIKYLKLRRPTKLGKKLNIGIAESHGEVIQRLDDDDYYHPEFLSTTINTLTKKNDKNCVAAHDCFLVLLSDTGELKFSGHGWSANGTLCFYRDLWKAGNFRDVPAKADWWFLRDHNPKQIKIYSTELYILVRHQFGHVWNYLGDTDVTKWFRSQPSYHKTLKECIPFEDDRLFYKQFTTE